MRSKTKLELLHTLQKEHTKKLLLMVCCQIAAQLKRNTIGFYSRSATIYCLIERLQFIGKLW